MFSGEYDLERTCRCCLRDLSKLIPLNKPYRVCDDSEMKSTANQRTIGEVLMEFANIQVNIFSLISFVSTGNQESHCSMCCFHLV